jgi:hypothetical protein
LPDSQAGYFRSFELRAFFAANDDQHNTADESQTTEHGGNPNMLLIFPGGVDWPDVQYLFLMGVSESLIGQRQTSKNNQENPNQNDWFHIKCRWLNRASPPLNQVNHENCQCYKQQDVDESPQRVRRHHSEEPQNKQND